MKLAFDISGLSWKYRTGVQNLYWGFIQSYLKSYKHDKTYDFIFYDRSSQFNKEIHDHVGSCYKSIVPQYGARLSNRLIGRTKRFTGIGNVSLSGRINHVWNWDIHKNLQGQNSITIPDILPLEHKEWFDDKFIKITQDSLAFAEQHADYIFTISNDVKSKITKLTSIPEERIKVAYPGIDAAYFSNFEDLMTYKVLEKNNLKAFNYFISYGFVDPRKNLNRQIKAFIKFKKRFPKTKLKYVLAGVPNALSDGTFDLIRNSGLTDDIVFIGYQSKEDLIALISKASALLYCSITEGFGLPIIEAMALRTRVITSNTSSMRELGMGRTPLVDPFSIVSIAEAMEEVLDENEEKKKAILLSNQKFAQNFTEDQWLKSHIIHYEGTT